MRILRLIVGIAMIYICFPLMANDIEKAPAEEVQIYSMDYRAIWIDNNCQAHFLNASQEVEVIYNERTVPYFNGIIPGLGYAWIPGDALPEESGIIINNGIEVGTINNSDTVLYFYPALLKKDKNENFSIVAAPEEEIMINIIRNSSTVCFDYNSMDYYHGFGIFVKNETNELVSYNNCMVVKNELTPNEDVVYYPPLQSDIDTCQVVSYTFEGMNMLEDKQDNPEVRGFLANAVFTEDAVYLNGFFTGIKYNWIKGDIKDDKVIFKKGMCLGTSGLRLGVYTYELSMPVEFTPVESDLIFEYDASTHTLHSPNYVFIAVEDVNKKLSYKYPSKSANWNEIYVGTEVSPFNEGKMIPAVPENVKVQLSQYPYTHEDRFAVIFSSSNFSKDGKIMDADKLYYRLICDGETYVLNKNIYSLEEDMEEIPYLFTHYSNSDCLVYAGKEHSVWIPEELKDCEWGVELIYYGGNERTVSEIGYSLTGINSVSEEEGHEYPLYDFSGKRIDRKNAVSGIYISNGEKFILK